MSKSIGNEWPPSLLEQLDGRRVEQGVGLTILLMTTDSEDWPSVTMLSVGEVVAPTPRTARLALWPGTTATENLTRTPRATLAFFAAGPSYYVRLGTQRRDNLKAGGIDHALFDATVQDVLRDEVTYARITSGVTFELPDPAAVVSRWRATVDAMLALPSVGDEASGPR